MHYVILGASAAGINCAKTLRHLKPEAKITVVSKDAHVYSRCMLHQLIGGKREIASLNFAGRDFFEQRGIGWIKGTGAKKLDPDTRCVLLDNGAALFYDKLLIATGASSVIPAVKNLRDAQGVVGLRNLEDAQYIKNRLKDARQVVVLGAGLVGMDAVSALLEHHVQVALVEMAAHVLPAQLDAWAASAYEKLLREKGVAIYSGVSAQEALVDDRHNIRALELSNGKILECQMIIVGAGVRANVDFIPDGALRMNDRIVADPRGRTSRRDIYAAGDVCLAHRIWPLAVKQGIAAAYQMAEIPRTMDDTVGSRNALNFFGLQTISLGMIEPLDDTYRVYERKWAGGYQKIVEKEGVIHGAILQGDIAYCGTKTHLIESRVNIAGIKKDIFDVDYADFYRIGEDGRYTYAVSGANAF